MLMDYWIFSPLYTLPYTGSHRPRGRGDRSDQLFHRERPHISTQLRPSGRLRRLSHRPFRRVGARLPHVRRPGAHGFDGGPRLHPRDPLLLLLGLGLRRGTAASTADDRRSTRHRFHPHSFHPR